MADMQQTSEQIDATEIDTSKEELDKEQIASYLDNNGLIAKWQVTGLLDKVEKNSEKFFIASIMEAMVFKSFEMCERDGISKEEMLQFQEKYITFMSTIGVFNGGLLTNINYK